MTELVQTAALQATTLAEYLTTPSSHQPPGNSSAPELMAYRGVLTPLSLDAPEARTGAEIRALLGGAAVHDLGWLRRIAIRGEDRFRWLSGMVTNAVETLPDRSGVYNLVLNAQGRIQGDAYAWKNGDDLELEIAAEQSEALLNHFDHFIIMDDVELVPLPDRAALGITGPLAGQILAKLGLSELAEELSSADGTIDCIPVRLDRGYGTMVPHYVLWTVAANIPALWEAILAAGAAPVGTAAYETLRVIEGIPAYGIDIQSRDLAQETSQTRALNFTKGCYLGQEIVERIRSRGQVHRHLRPVELFLDGPGGFPTAGAELQLASTVNGKPVGNLTSVTVLLLNDRPRIFAIAMVRAEAEVGNQPLTYPGGRANILNAAPNLRIPDLRN